MIITIVGFIPTFLLRPFFRESSLPVYLILHGVLMLLWFGAYFLQNLWAVKGQMINHRKFGMYWFFLAILMAVGNLNVVIHIANEIVTGKPTYFDAVRTVENSGGFVVGNLFITICSSLLIAIAYWKRRKPNAHKRAILGASFFLLTPAFDRFVRPFGGPEIIQYLGSYIIPISLVVFDIVRRKKVHPMTLLIVGLAFFMIPLLMAIQSNASFMTYIIEFIG